MSTKCHITTFFRINSRIQYLRSCIHHSGATGKGQMVMYKVA